MHSHGASTLLCSILPDHAKNTCIAEQAAKRVKLNDGASEPYLDHTSAWPPHWSKPATTLMNVHLTPEIVPSTIKYA